MAKPPSPLLGFNNNVKHQGRIFHVQTEDSGINRPHILTHLFADGGRIIKSTRTDYSEHIGRSDMSAVVRRMMKEQHKAMFIALRDGQLDATIEDVLEPVGGEAPAAAPVEPPAPRRSKPPLPGARRRSKPPPTMPEAPAAATGTLPPDPPPAVAAVASEKKPARSHEPVPRPTSPTLTDLVLADLEAAKMRGMPAATPSGTKPGIKGTPVLGTPAIPSRPPPAGRYAASRPAAIFTTSPEQGSIFGGASISEQSLDEVILSYLAEDLDGSTEE